MASEVRIVLNSFQGGRAIIDIHYSSRHARLELDRLEDRYSGQPTSERAGEELASLAQALESWLARSGRQIEGA
jgi:hypothetical protein